MASREEYALNINQVDDDNDKINFSTILPFLLRNKKLISFSTILITILGIFLFTTQKKIWQGEFQIVLENEEMMGGVTGDLDSAQQLLLGNQSVNYLDTEVAILKSPSVLMPIFEFVKNNKIDDPSYKKLKFKKWKENSLEVNLVEGTSILELAYRDTDKNLILPVLTKISSDYQDYSGKKRSRTLELGKKFFQNQIKIYKQKSEESIRNAQNFATENDLSILSGSAEIDSEIVNNINIEQIRIQNQSIIKNSKLSLKELEDIGEDPQKIVYIGSSIPELVATGLPDKVKDLEFKIALKKIDFRDTDPLILKLEIERDILTKLLRKEAIGFLNQKIKKAEINLKSSERPKGVLIKYKQLLAQSQRDAATLSKLEQNNISLLLEEARKEDPWELITSPTLLSEPVSPSFLNYLGISFISGFLLGAAFSYINEKKTNIVYSSEEIKKSETDILDYVISAKDLENLEELINTIFGSTLIQKQDKFAFIDCGEIISNINKIFDSNIKLKTTINDFNYINESQLSNSYTKSILLIKLGITTKRQILEVKKKLKLYGISNLGFIFLKDVDSEIN